MDFMANLPPSRGFDVIMLVVDQFNKMAHFIPIKESATAQETGRLLFTHMFKHHGLPKDIVLDRNPKFTNRFWQALWKCMGLELKMNTNRQTDEKNELGYPTISKELCGNESTKLSGPFGIGQVLL
jgi:hypothetical protein